MPRGRPRKTFDPKTMAAGADVARRHAEHWEREARDHPFDPLQKDADWFPAAAKAGHWRILEKEIRSMADAKPCTTERRQ
jgi:hypothetical protein